jgi:hypothetical protein
VPIVISLDEKDPNFAFKLKLINEKKSFNKFRVVDNLDEKVMREFISWIRYCEYDEDISMLYLEKNELVIEAQKKRQNQNQNMDSDDSDNGDIQNVFKGTSIRPMSIHNEVKVWNRIISACKLQLEKYPSSYEDDLKILEEDEKE